ncbi:caspase-3-like isoform X2 [Apostichopus japonicus]|uniref:caspase-3-like isoform X2 n=1 Tax=Stichopus japonicus TaxID=307972 RepID=UPI003AB1D9D5
MFVIQKSTKQPSKKFIHIRTLLSPEIDVDERYKVCGGKKPVALIFNNNNFKHMNQRTGSIRDVDNLNVLLEGLGFEIKKFHDLTASDMKKALLEASKREYAGTNYFFCALCSHGDDGVIFGTDGDPTNYGRDPHQDNASWLQLRDIFDMFYGENCKSLVGKPKMFVIQACRGKELQSAELEVDSDVAVNVADVGVKPTIPSEADFVVAYSTSEGNAAIRHRVDGSWYIQDFVRVFNSYGTQTEFQQLLTVVNRLVSDRTFSRAGVNDGEEKGTKQMPCFLSKFTKLLYLAQ